MRSKKWINAVLLILTIIILFAICRIVYKSNSKSETEDNQSINIQQEKQVNSTNENENEEIKNWKIEIPAISLSASISEGTDIKTLNEFVGHFATTPKTEGNIGLAAHNRGYPVNYFEKLKDLEGGEEVIYTYGEFTKTYVVEQNIKISDIDWSYLENSNENKITLITCIENEPAYRRCVQAIEKEEK